MKILILQHESETPAGSTLDWLQKKNISHEIILVPEVKKYPRLEDFDGLIILGGSMNVDQEQTHPWLIEEKNFLRACIQQKKKILGLCLGSQLLAEVLGAHVESMNKWEIGWFDVQADHELVPAFHWHQYNFTIPLGAQAIASSQACRNQGFTYQDFILAYQFHPEVDENWIQLALKDWSQQDLPGAVQTSEQIRALNDEKLPQTQKWYFEKLENFFIGIHN